MARPMTIVALGLLSAGLASCSASRQVGPAPLGFNTIACRTEADLGALHVAGDRFQREADDRLASGRCRVFAASSLVRSKRHQGNLVVFEAEAGTVFYAGGPG